MSMSASLLSSMKRSQYSKAGVAANKDASVVAMLEAQIEGEESELQQLKSTTQKAQTAWCYVCDQ